MEDVKHFISRTFHCVKHYGSGHIFTVSGNPDIGDDLIQVSSDGQSINFTFSEAETLIKILKEYMNTYNKDREDDR